MKCVQCTLNDLINFISNKYHVNRKHVINIYYKLYYKIKSKLNCEDDECNRKILRKFIKDNRFYRFFNNLTNCQLDSIIDNILELCENNIEPEPDPELGLRLTFTPGNLPANNRAAWNTFFDVPSNGTP